jgi:hypothetical protein
LYLDPDATSLAARKRITVTQANLWRWIDPQQLLWHENAQTITQTQLGGIRIDPATTTLVAL